MDELSLLLDSDWGLVKVKGEGGGSINGLVTLVHLGRNDYIKVKNTRSDLHESLLPIIH